MKRKVLGSLGVLIAAVVLLVSSSVAYAAPNTQKGLLINTGSGLRGIVSTMVGTGSPPAFSFSAKSPDVYQLFFSSQIHPYHGCIQAEVYHERVVGGATSHVFQFYPKCGTSGAPLYAINLGDATFRGKYVRTNTWNDTGFAFQDENLDVRVYNSTGTTWVGQVYNYNTSAWDTLATLSGTSIGDGYVDFGDGGYTEDPTMSCPTLYPWGIAQIRGMQKYSGGTWTTIAAGDISVYDIGTMPCFSNNVYEVKKPNAWQFKVVPYGVSY